MELLQLLAESDGRLVTREEIEERLWGKDVFVDAEHGINTAIRKIRQVLDDDPEAPRFVLTVPRKGYRFIAEVRRDEAGPEDIAEPAQESPARVEEQGRKNLDDDGEKEPSYMAEQAAMAGQRLEALRYIQQAFEERDAHLVYLEHNPAFDALRSEPRFVAIAKKMHLPEAESD